MANKRTASKKRSVDALKTIATAPACRAIRAGAQTWPLPNGGYFSGGRTYTHGLKTKRGTTYMVSREVMREIECTKFDMLVESSAKTAQGVEA